MGKLEDQFLHPHVAGTPRRRNDHRRKIARILGERCDERRGQPRLTLAVRGTTQIERASSDATIE